MTIFRMFCALHTPAEEHQCNFDYQVSKLKVSLWWWSIWLYGVDDTEWFNPQWFWRNEKQWFPFKGRGQGADWRGEPQGGGWIISVSFFLKLFTRYISYTIQSNYKVVAEKVKKLWMWRPGELLEAAFSSLTIFWDLLCFGKCSLTFVSDIHWCAINWTQPCQIVLQMYIAQLIYMLGCWVMCPTTVKICAADVKYVLRSWRMAAAAQIYANANLC